MRIFSFLFLLVFLVSCAGNAHLQRVVHEGPNTLVVLDKEKVSVTPPFPAPYHHPATISPSTFQQILESVIVKPQSGFLNAIISGGKKGKPLFDSETAGLISSELSKALADADPSERINFYRAIPHNSSKVSVTSGFLLMKDKRLHIRVHHYRVPLRKGSSFLRVGKDIPPSEKVKYRFSLIENKQMSHRKFKNMIGFDGSDSHWLVIDYLGLISDSANTTSKSGKSTLESEGLEEKLRALKRLREEDLISEEEYRKKKQSLLKDF